MPTAALTQAPTRQSRTGVALRKPAGGPPALTKHHLLLVEFMVHGLPRAFPRWPDVEPHRPLSVNEAADVIGMRRKNARDLLNQPIWRTRYHAEIEALRTGEHARSVHKLFDIRDDAGAGKAADRKVQMGAALAILGEHASGSTVNVNVDARTQIAMQPGVVIRLPAAAPVTKLDNEDQDS